jgi:hypothetical protein
MSCKPDVTLSWRLQGKALIEDSGPGHVRFQQADVLREEKYDPDISRAREFVWKAQKSKGEMITSKDLASKLVLQFPDLVERDRAGKVKRKERY